MTVFQRVGVTSGGSLDVAATYVSLQAGSDGQVVLHDYGFGVSSQWHVQNNGASRASNDRILAEAPRVEVTIAGREGGLLRDALNGAFDSWDAGERSAETMFLGETAHGFDAVTVLTAQVGGRQMVYAATQNSAGLTAFQYNGAELSSPASYTGAYSDFISDMAIVETGGGDYLFTASATQHGITSYGMSATGALSALGALSAEDSLPVATLTALDAAQVGGNAFLIAAAAGTSSLTVLSVSNTGQLAVADHITDGLDTRFQGVSQLEVVQMGAQSLVMASGMDDGLSLFRLTSEGRLIHVDTIADSTTTALDGISGLETVTHSTGFNVFTTSASEAGMTQFRVDFAPNGIIAKADGMLQGTAGADILTAGDAEGARIQAGAGDDILIDGADENRLQGGVGADIFVFIQDGERDWIDDFDAAHDTIDLSAWEGLTAANQLDIKSNDNGARVLFGEERLDVRTADATPLTVQQVMNAAAVFLSHVDVILGPRLVSEAPPPPPPTVTPEQSTASPPHVGEGTESTSEWDVNLENDQHPDDQPGGEPEFVTDENPDAVAGSLGLTLQGGDGDDVLTGSALDDAISGGAGNDTITGDAGNDMIAGAVGDDVVRGGDGNDSIGGGLGSDTIEGGAGDDQVGGGRDNDVISGQGGNDLLSGGAGNDLLRGGDGDDMLAGGFGNDTVQGEGGDDNMGGGTGKDRMTGGEGNDTMGGGEGDDRLEGGAGHDFVAGGGRNDTLEGGGGADKLNGGAGNDVMTGGSGGDMFIFNEMTKAETDVITDFQVGVDTLRLHGIAGANQSARFNNLDITQEGQAVEIHYDGHTIRLDGVQVGQLDQSDFLLL